MYICYGRDDTYITLTLPMASSGMRSMYISNVHEINKLQTDIMVFIGVWIRTQKTPVPQKEIFKEMKTRGVKDCTTLNALNGLVRKKYIRKGINYNSVFQEYVQLRTVAV